MTIAFFLSGITLATFFIAGLFFLKFYMASGDRLFQMLTLACWMLAVERLAGLITYIDDPSTAAQDSTRVWLYLFRLFAFVLILFGVIQKNRKLGSR